MSVSTEETTSSIFLKASSKLRDKATARPHRLNALGVWPTEEEPPKRETEDGLAASLQETYPDDLIFELDAATLLADRRGIARGVLAADLESEGERFIGLLRDRIPPDREPRSWLREKTNLSMQGRDTVSKALEQGDMGAVHTLTASYVREWRGPSDILLTHAESPMSEADARALIDAVWLKDDDGPVRWVVLQGIEACLTGASPHVAAFRRGLEEWLRLQPTWSRVVLVLTCWRPATARLSVLDSALHSYIQGQRPEERVGGEEIELTPSAEQLRAFIQDRLDVRLRKRLDDPVWTGTSSRGGLALIWPAAAPDPAAEVTRLAGEIGDKIVGGGLAVIAPAWAMGSVHAQSRTSLQHTFSYLGWLELPHAAVVHFSQPDGEAPEHLREERRRFVQWFDAEMDRIWRDRT